jgi:hypothetical protein
MIDGWRLSRLVLGEEKGAMGSVESTEEVESCSVEDEVML